MSGVPIAGHYFTEDIHGRVCSCGRRWRDICNATADDVGQEGIAHSGKLSQYELDSIRAERERIWGELVCVVTA